jgi:hypothetical protein
MTIILISSEVHAACTGSSPTWTTTPDQASISSCISSAVANDTVIISAGTGTISSTITVTKGITIQGAGIDTTTIVCDASLAFFKYVPSDFTLNTPFRVTGLTFNMNNLCDGIILGYSSSSYVIQTKIRIDHNKFIHSNSSQHNGVHNWGMRGVVDHNQFIDTYYPIRSEATLHNGQEWWNNWEGVVFGKADNNMYFEDNIIETKWGIVSDCQFANRYVFRYNTITSTTTDSYPLFDMHGNHGYWSCFGGEIYGNYVNAGTKGVELLDQRGGRAIVFNNNIVTTSLTFKIQVRDEDDDAKQATIHQPQHVINSYYWSNIKNTNTTQPLISLLTQAAQSLESRSLHPIPNQDYFSYTPTFNGTSGMGCGTLANRPTTCTPGGTDTFGNVYGPGYWATDQSCSDMTGMVGDIITYPTRTTISGTLYKCTATNTWTAIFTPYTYPHPLTYVLKLKIPTHSSLTVTNCGVIR